jgi:sugar/nucleoside kinase (ribokinase family)
MKKVISAGHICLDITPVFPAGKQYDRLSSLLVPGKLIQMEAADVHTGGSVANTGLALKLLGCDVTLLGKVGDDAFGMMIRNVLARYDAGGLLVDPESSTSYSVVLAVPGVDRVFLHNPGANDTFIGTDIPENALEDAALFHFGYPTLMRRTWENDGAELISMFRRVKEKGIATSLDLAAVDPQSPAGHANWEKILTGVLPYVDFFVPSFEELCWMLDRERYNRLASAGGDMTDGLDMETDALPLAEKLLSMGCRIVMIKCGTSGMLLRTAGKETVAEVGSRLELNADKWSDQLVFQSCFKADVVRSGTGAGDTSIAAFLAAVLSGRDPSSCIALASAEGACCVTAYDALSGLKLLDELEERIRKGW